MDVSIRTHSGHFRDILTSGFLQRSSSDIILIGENNVKIQMHSLLLTRSNQFLQELLQTHLSCHCGGPVYISIPELSSNVLEDIVKLLYSSAGALEASSIQNREDIAEAARLLGFNAVKNSFEHIEDNDDENTFDYTNEDTDEEPEESNKFKIEKPQVHVVLKEEKVEENYKQIKFTKQETKSKRSRRTKGTRKGMPYLQVLHDGKPLDANSSICPECHKEYPSHYRMRKHYRNLHTERGRATIRRARICPECGQECIGSDGLRHHIATHHTSAKNWACDECDYACKSSSALAQHKKRHHQEKAFFCDQCDKSYAIKATLEAHIRSSHQGVRVTCPECGLIAKSSSHLNYHIRNVHQGQKYGCTQCPQQYNQRSNLIIHMRKAHNTEIAKFHRNNKACN